MVARVTQYRIRPGKMEEFTSTVESLIPALDRLKGFRVLLMLQGADPASREATAISVWESSADLRDSDNDEFYYHAIAQLLKCCESFSPMREEKVMVSKFAHP
jgi:heme-degrading monooxygenase HmoA